MKPLPLDPTKYIGEFYRRFDLIPTETCIANYLHGRKMTKIKQKIKSAFTRLEKRGILTPIGPFTGRRHLTQAGYVYYSEVTT